MSQIGERIRELRLAKGLSQRQLAATVGVSFPHVSKIEGGIETASNALLSRFAEALDTDPDELFLLADRLTDEVSIFLREKTLAPEFLRRWREGGITDEQVQRLLRKSQKR